jgi:hypothetical protein
VERYKKTSDPWSYFTEWVRRAYWLSALVLFFNDGAGSDTGNQFEKNIGTREGEPGELKDLCTTCAKYYDEHVPESSFDIVKAPPVTSRREMEGLNRRYTTN